MIEYVRLFVDFCYYFMAAVIIIYYSCRFILRMSHEEAQEFVEKRFKV